MNRSVRIACLVGIIFICQMAFAAAPITFRPLVSYSVGTYPLDVAVGDLNGDGHLDLVVANRDGQSISVLLGRGDGTFAAAVNYVTPNAHPVSVALGDFNGDHRLDVAVDCADFVGSLSGIMLFLGIGDGTLAPPAAIPLSYSSMSIGAADLDGDGKLDLVLAMPNAPSYMLGNGDGTFQPFQLLTSLPSTLNATVWYAAVADVNGDGRPDILTANIAYQPSAAVYLNAGKGSFEGPVLYQVAPDGGGGADGVLAADLRGIGKPDLIAVTTHNFLGSLLGNGDGTFHQYDSGYGGSSPVRIVAADLNGDGYLDIAIADANSASACTCTPDGHGVTTYMGDGSGSLSSSGTVQQFAPGVRASAIALGDFNEDGHLDLVITDIGNNVVSVLLNNAAATAPTVTLALGNTPTAGASLTLMATVSSSTGPATGTVSFLDNSTTIGTATLAGGSASFTMPSVAAGAHSFSATYAGSGTVGAGASAPVTVNVAQDFALMMPASVAVLDGQAANVAITVSPQPGGFNSPVQFSCSGVPPLASCDFLPTSVTPGAASATVNLTIHTTARIAALHTNHPVWPIYAAFMPAFGFVLLAGLSGRKMRTIAIVLLLGICGLAGSCGGGAAPAPTITNGTASSAGTPIGTYTITVAALSGSTVHNAALTFTVH